MSEKEPFRAIYYGESAKKPPTEAYIILGFRFLNFTDNTNKKTLSPRPGIEPGSPA